MGADPSFGLLADDANLAFQDSSFNGSVFMHSGAYVNLQSIAFNGHVTPPPSALWTTTFSGGDGDDRGLTNTPVDPAFTDTLAASDLTLAFQDTSFTYLYSSTLGGWTPFTPVSVTSTGTSPVETVTVEVPVGIMEPKFFVRVEVVGN